MILTGKAKHIFCDWRDKEKRDLRKSYLDDTCYNAIIIEWLDSVGIYLSPNYEEYIDYSVRGLPIKIKNWFCWVNEELLTGFSSRQQATEKAIEIANEIYNKGA